MEFKWKELIANEQNNITIEDPQPKKFYWQKMDLNESNDMTRILVFLNKHYNNIIFTVDFLRLAIVSEQYDPSHSIALMTRKHRIAGFVAVKQVKVQHNQNVLSVFEIKFLCVHSKLRKKDITKNLIQKIAYNIQGSKCIFFTEIRIPKQLTTIQYYYQPLNIKRLTEINFMKDNGYQIYDRDLLTNISKMKPQHLDIIFEIFMDYLQRYNYHPVFTKAEFKKIFIDSPQVVKSYVVEDDDEVPIDFISYYIQNLDYKGEIVKVAYLYYYTSLIVTPFRLIKDVVTIAKRNSIDLFIGADMMENSIIKDIGFCFESKKLNYYICGQKYIPLKANQNGYVPGI